MKRMTWLATGMIVFLSAPVAADKRPFTIDDLYRLKSVSGLALAPAGKRLVFEVSYSNLKKAEQNTDLHEIRLSSLSQRPLTTAPGPETSAFWSKDGKTLYFVAQRDGTPQVYGLPADGGEARKLTDFAPGVSSPLLLADGRTIVFASAVYAECGSDPECHKKQAERMASGPVQAHLADSLLYRHWTRYREFMHSHLFSCDLETGKVTMLTKGKTDYPSYTHGDGRGFDAAPDGRELCVVANCDPHPETSTNSDLFLLPLDRDGPPVNITAGNRAFDGDPLYSPDGRWIAYRTQAVPGFEADRFRIALYDRAAKVTRVLSGAIDNWAEKARWTPDSRSILFLVREKGATPLYRVDVGSGKISRLLAAKSIREFIVHSDGRGIYFIQSAVGRPLELWTARFDGRAPRPLTSLNQKLADEVDIRPAEEMWVKGANGRDIHVFIVKPHGFTEGEKYPLILNIHGGPQGMWSDSFRGDWQVYPGAGYVVAFPNPHGSTGYGQEFTAAISRDWNGKVMEDIEKVSARLAELPYVDAGRMGAMGWSWGGYAVMWLEGASTRFQALAAMMGVYDLRAMHGATEELWFPQWDLGGTPWGNAEAYERMSPCSRVAKFKTPCLVITGERDYRVPYTQSLHFFTDLQAMGVPSRLIVFKNDGHWPDNLKSMPVYYNAHLEWFHHYLGGGKAPYSTEQMIRNSAFQEADKSD
ncbi:MAG: S9 family peptidase [Candidatus Aminicenantes bacterium]|nr:S9 family peptidase [Candidatus Aminicenantes bacterium]